MRKVRICHVISSIDKNYGGSAAFVQLITNEIVKYRDIIIVTNKTNRPLDIDSRVQVFMTPPSFRFLQGYSTKLRSTLNSIECDLFHGNGIWQFPVHAMAEVAKRKKIPYLISPHGMLESWALNDGNLKKRIALQLYQRKDLKLAACLHATARKEADNIRKLGFKNPVAIIPNGIDLTGLSLSEHQKEKEKRTILFLSRIHPSKGIELLIQAWESLPLSSRNNWQIKIAGNGDLQYLSSLQQLIDSKNLGSGIRILGPQYDNDKLKLYREADLFVLPTFSENFGIVVAEALACGVPVITTKGAPWEELITYKAGWWIDFAAEPLASALLQAIQLSPDERMKMGRDGRKLIEEKYTIERVTLKMIELYDWVLGKTGKPDFVYLD